MTVVLEYGDKLIPTAALDDTGAGANFISLSLAEQIGFDLNWAKRGPPIKLGDSSNVPCYGTVKLTLRLDATQPYVPVTTEALVVGQLSFPLILGYPFGKTMEKNYSYTDGETWVEWMSPEGIKLRTPVREGVHTDAQLNHLALTSIGDGADEMTGVLQVQLAPTKECSPTLPFETMVERAPARLQDLLEEYRDIFVRNDNPRPQHHGVVATIPTEDKVSYTKQFPLAHKHIVELETMLGELIDKDWVETSHSPFNNPIFLVPKSNGKWRIVLDFRGLNAITVKDKYRLPRIDELLNQVIAHKVLSTMDLVDGFYQIPLQNADRHRTTSEVQVSSGRRTESASDQ